MLLRVLSPPWLLPLFSFYLRVCEIPLEGTGAYAQTRTSGYTRHLCSPLISAQDAALGGLGSRLLPSPSSFRPRAGNGFQVPDPGSLAILCGSLHSADASVTRPFKNIFHLSLFERSTCLGPD